MFSKSHTSASATGAQRTDEVAKLSIWRERVEKEARQYENFPKHAYAPNPRTLVMLPEKPTAVSFESRCPRPAAIATASSSSACVNGSGNSNGSANASFTQSGQGRSATLAAAGLDATARNGGNNSTMSSTGRGNGSNMGRTGGKSGRLDSATVAALREELFSTMHRSLLPPQARHPFPASSNQVCVVRSALKSYSFELDISHFVTYLAGISYC